MLKNYFKIALRNFLKTKGFSMINIAGLSVCLAVVLIIGLWIKDELSFNTSFPRYKKIVQVLQNQTNHGKTETQEANPCVLADELPVWRTNGGFNWKGKDPNFSVDFPNNGVSHNYGKTIGWRLVQGRDYKAYAPDVPFSYNFVDARFVQKFGEEERIGKLSSLFTYMAMFISMLGLIGLAAYTAERRTKEIGVRKVLGASLMNICRLIAKEFVVLTLISFLVAVPVSYFFMNNWLQNFEYRASISIWIYRAAGIFTLLLTILVVSFQAIRAALANPVKALRSE